MTIGDHVSLRRFQLSFSTRYLLCLFLALILLVDQGQPHGCIPSICEGNEGNEHKKCVDPKIKDCGHYGSERWGHRFVQGVDVACDHQNKVYAPFNGTIYYYTPFGDGTCLDMGVKIQGEGAWDGYFATISYMKPYKTSGKIKQGQLIGRAQNLRECKNELASDASENHILFELYKHGRVIDPTSHLQECMCTGRICESNNKNDIEGQAFKGVKEFGLGFELACKDVKEEDGNAAADKRTPLVYSPIDGERLGRIRLREAKDNIGDCTNDGVFIIGSGKWKDFAVRIYNVKFHKLPGKFDIKQGDPVAKRLDCEETDESATIFLEFRRRGRLVNITNQIIGESCTMPEF